MEKQSHNISDIGVVIPAFNEAKQLPDILTQLHQKGFTFIVIVDAGSTDGTCQIAEEYGVNIVHSVLKNRAHQLNLGSEFLKTNFLLFLHADVQLTFVKVEELLDVINQPLFSFANFRLKFDSNHWFLKLNALFSYLKVGAFQFGDQGLLVNTSIFYTINGYDEDLLFMEGNHIIRKLRKSYPFIKLKGTLLVASRKYDEVGIYRLQIGYFIIYFLERLGLDQKRIKRLFDSILGS